MANSFMLKAVSIRTNHTQKVQQSKVVAGPLLVSAPMKLLESTVTWLPNHASVKTWWCRPVADMWALQIVLKLSVMNQGLKFCSFKSYIMCLHFALF